MHAWPLLARDPGALRTACGGGRSLGQHCAARGTFWNIRAGRDQDFPFDGFGPDSMVFVGVQGVRPSIRDIDGKWFETIEPTQLMPNNIHEAQLQRRLRAPKSK